MATSMNPFTKGYVEAVENALSRANEMGTSVIVPGYLFPLPRKIADDEGELDEVCDYFFNLSWGVDTSKIEDVRGDLTPHRLHLNNSAHAFPTKYEV
jgi:hypothetical protein